jgi:hypothetical protein
VARRAAEPESRARAAAAAAAPARLSAGACALLAAGYLGLLFALYARALSGPFVSDDIHYVAANPYVHGLSLANLRAILVPWGPATVAVVNYSPVQLLLHATVWQLFGADVFWHHALSLGFHAVASALFLPLLLRSGLSLPAAALGSLLFLLHPANVEAVAWISQLKSTAGLAFGFGAVLAHPRRPLAALALFALALLTKANAAVVLPLAFWLAWCRDGALRPRWLGAWLLLFAAYAIVEFSAHQRSGAAEATLHQTPFVLLRTMCALAARYLAMAASGLGLSTFHEPEPARSLLDPWWLASLPLLALLGVRLLATARARRPEAGWWAFALISFGPVSQLFPFLYPLADRYLYFILPGLVGGALCALQDAAQRLPAPRRRIAGRLGLALGLSLCALFAARSVERAALWRSPFLLLADAARNYPDGVSANLSRARTAAQQGDALASARFLRAALARGFNRFEQLAGDPVYDAVRDSAAFRGVLRDMAAVWIEAGSAWKDPTQGELRRLASAHALRGEREQAVALLRRALERGGPFDAGIRDDLAALGASP